MNNEIQKDLKRYLELIGEEHSKEAEDNVIRFFANALPIEFWNEYLAKLDTGVQGLQLHSGKYKWECENQTTSIWENSSTSSSPTLKKAVADAMLSLSSKQRQIIELYFFESKSEYEIATLLNITQPSVHNLKVRALNRIKEHLLQKAIDLTIIEEQKIPQKDILDQIEEHYWEDRLTDDEFYHLWALAEVGGLKVGSL